MVEVDLSAPDILPLPVGRAREGLPINRTFTGTYAAPNRGLRVQLDWNNASDYWSFQVSFPNEGVIIERRPVTLAQEYSFRGRLFMLFIDPYRQADKVTPQNLGDSVGLWCYPGPESPGWEGWLAANRLDEQRLDTGDETSLIYS